MGGAIYYHYYNDKGRGGQQLVHSCGIVIMLLKEIERHLKLFENDYKLAITYKNTDQLRGGGTEINAGVDWRCLSVPCRCLLGQIHQMVGTCFCFKITGATETEASVVQGNIYAVQSEVNVMSPKGAGDTEEENGGS